MRSMNLIHKALLLISLLLSGFMTYSQAQSVPDDRWANGVSEPWWFAEKLSREDIATMQSRWSLIRDENQANEWAGDYFIGGDTHGSYLRWSAENGYVLVHVNKCEAKVESFEYGKVSASPTLIQFFPEFSKSDSGHTHSSQHQTPTRWLPVKWRATHYLVPENGIAAFGDYVAGLGAYNFGLGGAGMIEVSDFFSKFTDEERDSAEGLPIVPPGYERFIKRPIDARITNVGRSYIRVDRENEWYNDLVTLVTVNVGRADGVKRRMTFHVLGSENSEMVKIRRVGAFFSRRYHSLCQEKAGREDQ